MSERIRCTCKGCVFAKYDNFGNQDDCSLGLLSGYRNVGANVYPRIDDNEKLHYVIEGRVCRKYRSEQWKWANSKNRNKIVEKECEIKYDMVVYIGNDTSVFEVEESIKNINKLPILPQEVVFLVHNFQPPAVNKDIYNSFKKLNEKILYSAEIVMSRVIGTKLEALNLAVDRLKRSQFFMFCLAGKEIDGLIIETLNLEVNTCLKQVVMMLPRGTHHQLTINTNVFNMVGGSSRTNVINKIRTKCREENCERNIVKLW